MFRAFATYYSPEELNVLEAALAKATQQLAPECSAEPPPEQLQRAVATAILRVAKSGITDAERMKDEALQLMRQEGSLGPHGVPVVSSSARRRNQMDLV